jgi:fucose permease
MRSPETTLRLFPWFAALSLVPLMVPVMVLFWEDNGLDTFDIYVLQAAFALASVLLEVPTGLVADRLGKRASLLSGQIAVAVGCVIYALGTGFWSFLVAEVVLALGVSLLSGADAALLYDSLQRLGR